MLTIDASAKPGIVDVVTSDNGGFPLEKVVDMALNKLINVSAGAPAPIRDQAFAFKSNLREVLDFYIKMAIEQDRATLCYKLRKSGHSDLANHLGSL